MVNHLFLLHLSFNFTICLILFANIFLLIKKSFSIFYFVMLGSPVKVVPSRDTCNAERDSFAHAH